MPIDFAPPQVSAQPFQIQPVQYTDPLQTLAQMGQLRNQALQGQLTSQELQQKELELQSNKALMNAFVQGGGDYDKTYNIAAQSGNVLPTHLINLKNQQVEYQKNAALLNESQQKILKADNDRYSGLLDGVEDQNGLDLANMKAKQMGIGANVPRITLFTDKDHIKGFQNSLLMHSDMLEQAKTTAQTEQAKAATAASEAQTEEAQQKVATGQRNLAVADIQAAPTDQTGVPTPAAWAALQQKYPKVGLPDTPTKQWISQFVRSSVPAEKQPEFDLNTMKTFLGMMGNTEFDQYLLQGARGINKTPTTLTPSEFQTIFQKYSEDKQDPIMRALAISLKGLQTQQTQATLSSMPTEQGIQDSAKDLVNGDFTPQQLADLRSGRIAGGPRVIEAARAYAKANNIPFSLANLEIQAQGRADTELKFNTGPEAQMVRSFDNLMQHTSMLKQAWQANQTSDFPALKRIANALGIQFGSDAPTTYDLIADYVSNEAAKAFLPSGGGEAERARNYSHFERKLGDKQISSNIVGLMGLADAQREGLERQYQEGTYGKGPRIGKLFSNQALQARDQLMGKTPSGGPVKGDKKTYQGHTYQFDGKQWVRQ